MTYARSITFLLLAFALASCATTDASDFESTRESGVIPRDSAPPPPPPPPPPPANGDYAYTSGTISTGAGQEVTHRYVPVFFGTNRAPAKARWGMGFGEAKGPLRYGVVRVSVPIRHSPGEIERPDWTPFNWSDDPRKHFTILALNPLNGPQMFSQLTERMGWLRQRFGGSERSALLFVHGYNVSFEDAAYRTAQVAHDIRFQGVPIFYSWPSKVTTALYTHDRTRIDQSESLIGAFIVDVLDRAKPDKLYILAHSMGARGVSQALSKVAATRPDLKDRIAALILASPDIDKEVFVTNVAPRLSSMARSVTTYVSSRDKALLASQKVNGDYALGDARGGIAIVPGMMTVDASNVDTDFLGHSYFGSEVSLLHDIRAVVAGAPFGSRKIRPKTAPAGAYCFPKAGQNSC